MKIGIATLNSQHHQQIALERLSGTSTEGPHQRCAAPKHPDSADAHASAQQAESTEDDSFTIGSSQTCDVVISSDATVNHHHCDIRLSPPSSNEIPSNENPLTIEIVNHGYSIVLSGATRLHRGQSIKSQLPVSFSIGETRLQIFEIKEGAKIDESLSALPSISSSNPSVHHAAIPPTPNHRSCPSPTAIHQAVSVSPAPATLTSWLETVGELQKSVAGSQTFFKEAARAVFNPGGLDGCIILAPGAPTASDSEPWKIVGSHTPCSDGPINYRADLVRRAVAEQATLFHDTTQLSQELRKENGAELQAAVVSPVVDHTGKSIAVVYGFRNRNQSNMRIGTRTLEAQFVQLIASSILSAMTRLEREAEAARARVLLEQAFSPKIARHLEVNPLMLAGKTTDVTVLFADLREFSSISEAVGPELTHQLLTDIMDQFSDIIMKQGGVIIDYYGDGLSAFWNAPIAQPDHAFLACQAAQQIIDTLPELNETWAQKLKHELRVGVGVHSGVAQVGNSGSSKRIKYGPRGSTVNIASRLESATKSVGLPLLVSESVAQAVRSQYVARRICKTSLAGISTPLDVYELFPRPLSAGMQKVLETYARCLDSFEAGEFHDAATALVALSLEMPDQACEYLLKQTMNRQENPETDPTPTPDAKNTLKALTKIG